MGGGAASLAGGEVVRLPALASILSSRTAQLPVLQFPPRVAAPRRRTWPPAVAATRLRRRHCSGNTRASQMSESAQGVSTPPQEHSPARS
jgi:hypothetical protein